MKYCVLLCGLLLMQAVGLSAKERAWLQADGVNISRSGDSVHVSFRLKVERLAKDYILRVTPLLYGKDGSRLCFRHWSTAAAWHRLLSGEKKE